MTPTLAVHALSAGWSAVFLVCACVCFLLAAADRGVGRVNLVALGLLLWAFVPMWAYLAAS